MRILSITLMSFIALSLVSADARAFCLTIPQGQTKPVAWQTIPVNYAVSDNLKDTKILAAIDKAFQTWSAVKCSNLTFKKNPQFTMCTTKAIKSCASGTVHPLHAKPFIYVFWFTAATGFPVATTNASYVYIWFGMTQNITGASISANAFKYTWNSTGGDATKGILDVQNDMTALIGQVIGFENSKVPGATMYPGLKFGDTSKRTLAKDDIDGLVYLYTAKGCTKPAAPGTGGCSGGTTTGDGGPKADTSGPSADGSVTTGDGSSGDQSGTSGDGGVQGDGGSKQCTSSGQCASDEVCTAEGFCKKLGGGDDDGCSCKVGARTGNLGAPALGLLAVAMFGLLWNRRRRRRRR